MKRIKSNKKKVWNKITHIRQDLKYIINFLIFNNNKHFNYFIYQKNLIFGHKIKLNRKINLILSTFNTFYFYLF